MCLSRSIYGRAQAITQVTEWSLPSLSLHAQDSLSRILDLDGDHWFHQHFFYCMALLAYFKTRQFLFSFLSLPIFFSYLHSYLLLYYGYNPIEVNPTSLPMSLSSFLFNQFFSFFSLKIKKKIKMVVKFDLFYF